jgi:hypothetical protein
MDYAINIFFILDIRLVNLHSDLISCKHIVLNSGVIERFR